MDSPQQTLHRSLEVWKGTVSMDQGLSKLLRADDDKVSYRCVRVAYCKMVLMAGQRLA